MPSQHQWVAFLVASLLFIQVPGPSLLFTIGRALTVGRRDALLSALGNGVGVLAQVLLVAVGLGAVVAASATAYTVVKVAGAGYVVWLGVQAVRHRADARRALEPGAGGGATAVPARTPALRSLRIGVVVGATNPKTLVFFVAFLPQFTGTGPAGPQVALLGLVFCVLAAASDSLWVLVASQARAWFARRPERLDGLGAAGGALMVGLGTSMLVAER